MGATDGVRQEALAELRGLLQVDDAWFVPTADGFDWWPSTFRQRVTAEPAVTADGLEGARITIETPAPPVLAHAVGAVGLGGINRDGDATLFAAVQRDGALVYVSRAFVHEDNLDWMPELLSNAAIMQIGFARRDRLPQRMLGPLEPGDPLYEPPSAPPGRQPREDDDEIVQVFEQVYGAFGKQPFELSREDAGLIRGLAKQHAVRSTESAVGFTMELPFAGGTTAFLRTWNRWAHPKFGHGLRGDLTFPISAAPGQANALIGRLNEEEASGRREPEHGGTFLGTWTWAADLPGALRFASFYPALVAKPMRGLAATVTVELLHRAAWAAVRLHEPDLRPLWEPGISRPPAPPARRGLLGRLFGRRG